jgi:hypothetical protein
MNGNELYKVLSEIPVSSDDRALVNVGYYSKYLILTYHHDRFICQKFISCDTVQNIPKWNITVESDDFIHALHKASDYRNPRTKEKMRVWYRPDESRIVIEGEQYQQTYVSAANIYLYDTVPPKFIPFDDSMDAEIALLPKEWKQLYPFIHVARKGDNTIKLTTQGSHVWVTASSPSMHSYAYLKVRDSHNSTHTLSLDSEVVEYIQSLNPQPSYVELQLFENKVVILLTGERLIVDRIGHEGLKVMETLDGSILSVKKTELAKALASCAGTPTLNDPDCNQVSLSYTQKTGLIVSGNNRRQKIKAVDQVTEEGKIMLCSVALLDLLEEIEFDDLELELPAEEHPYEPLKITTRGAVYLVAGVVKKNRSFHRIQSVSDVWDESEPHKELVHSRCQNDGYTLNFFLVEESPLEPHFSQEELEAFFKESPYEDPHVDPNPNPIEQEFYRAIHELQDAYHRAVTIARLTRQSGALSQELRDRLKELKQVFVHSAHCFDYELNDQIVSNLDSEYLMREITQVRYSLQNIQVKAGRLLETLKNLDKTYRIEMTLVE